MKILCAVGQQGGQEIVRRVSAITGSQHELILLHVIDIGPHRGLEEYLHRPGRPLTPPPERRREMIDEAEAVAAQTALEEARLQAGQAGFASVQTELQRGKPEQVIVQLAHQWECQLVAIQASEGAEGRPHIGPESVVHTARFVLDHAPCDVLLLRD
jgi:nucleotide-binding universal stress UspA family protein